MEGAVCSGHGECVDGACRCDAGFASFDCSRRSCQNGCSGHGQCGVDGVCSCFPGWFGADCALPSCFRNCSGHGVCEASAASWLGQQAVPQHLCRCEPGWRGVGCELRSCPGSTGPDGGPDQQCGAEGCVECSGNGVCDTGSGECKCAAPWHGPGCDRYGCGPEGCGPHGLCVQAGVAPSSSSSWRALEEGGGGGEGARPTRRRYACACEPGWGGADCRSRLCSDECSHAGWCLNGTCTCYPGAQAADGKCSPTHAGKQLSLQCSLRCVHGCAELCARGGGAIAAGVAATVAPGERAVDPRVACEAECGRKCLEVCVDE